MERAGIDCWVLVAREYNEDPVVTTMLPATWINARRRTILVFSDYGRTRAAIARYGVGDAFPAAWDPEDEPDQWARLGAYLAEHSPRHIGLSRSETFALADGLSATEGAALVAALTPELASRIVPAESLAIGWLETRTDDEKELHAASCAIAHSILREALSPAAITPGATSTADVEWWLRQRVADLNLGTWFHPTVSVQRNRPHDDRDSFATAPGDTLIEPGDLVHIDFGIAYVGLHTDQQQHAYVRRPGEADAPAGISAGIAAANRAQDIVMEEFRTGRTGNEVLAAARVRAAEAGLDATIYSHPIGLHGHAAGPSIGLWDQQDGVAGQGDYPLFADTSYSIELSVVLSVAEWGGRPVRFMLEEEAFFDGTNCSFLDDRQTDVWLI
jgi:Xaa-Pro aminopeptidase